MPTFKEQDNLQLISLGEFQLIQKKYPGLIPVIIHPKDLTVSRSRYLTRGQIPFKKFAEIVRQYCQGISPQDPLFFTANGIFIPSKQFMDDIYNLYKKSDGFLHINVCPEPGQDCSSSASTTPASQTPIPSAASAASPVPEIPIQSEASPASESPAIKSTGEIATGSNTKKDETNSDSDDSLP